MPAEWGWIRLVVPLNLIGAAMLGRLAARLGWDGAQTEAARAELARRFAPTLVEI
jgi:hypothetical protein